MHKQFAFAASAALLSVSAHAVVVTQWNFNSAPPDASSATGSTVASIGTGTAALVGGATAAFASGTGSTDPAVADNTGWNTSTYAAQGTGDKTRGVSFAVSTLGYNGVSISWDQRHSNTASKHVQFQYSLDGTSFTDFGAAFEASLGGDQWYLNRSVDLSGVTGVNNNANFTFRIVSTFAPTTSTYIASTTGSNYATTGTLRYDMVTLNATLVPEPGTYAMLLAGLAAVGFLKRRRG